MQPKQVVRELRETSSRYGARAALYDLQCKVINRLAHVNVLRAMRVSLADVPSAEMFDAPGFEARFVSPPELDAVARAGTHDLTPEFLDRAIGRGDRCYGIFEGDALVSHGWYAQRSTEINEHYLLHFDPDHTYMFKGYTLPAHRGKRLHAVGMCRAPRVHRGRQEGPRLLCGVEQLRVAAVGRAHGVPDLRQPLPRPDRQARARVRERRVSPLWSSGDGPERSFAGRRRGVGVSAALVAVGLRSVEEAFHFGGAARSLFGVLHEPAAAGDARVVVVCAPLWREGIRAHRVLRRLGIHLTKVGHAVLRFDYSGAGDSAGESEHGDVDVWLADVAAAIDEVRRRRSVAQVTLLGLRFGATLAALAAARRDDVERLVLWEPVPSGAHYLDEGMADQRAWAERYAVWRRLPRAELPDGGDEILGFRVTPAMRLSIGAVDLAELPRTAARSVLIVDRSAPDKEGGLAVTLASRGARVDHQVKAESEVWKQQEDDGVAGARETLELIAHWLSGGPP